MKKTSFFLLLILIAIAVVSSYYATLDGSGQSLFIRMLGMVAFMLLILTLILGPLNLVWPHIAELIETRRAIGLASFVFVIAHLLLVVMFYFKWDIGNLVATPKAIYGTLATLIFIPLAITSSDFALRKLGLWWKRIQRFNYLAFVFVLGHFVINANMLGGARGTNEMEWLFLGLAIVAILLQIKGFLMVRSRMKKAKSKK
jgi:sulfoxide reductase heme-binding subunit YedZ